MCKKLQVGAAENDWGLVQYHGGSQGVACHHQSKAHSGPFCLYSRSLLTLAIIKEQHIQVDTHSNGVNMMALNVLMLFSFTLLEREVFMHCKRAQMHRRK